MIPYTLYVNWVEPYPIDRFGALGYTRVVGVQQCRSGGKCLGASLLVNYGRDTKAIVTYWLDDSPKIRDRRLTFSELFERSRSATR